MKIIFFLKAMLCNIFTPYSYFILILAHITNMVEKSSLYAKLQKLEIAFTKNEVKGSQHFMSVYYIKE